MVSVNTVSQFSRVPAIGLHDWILREDRTFAMPAFVPEPSFRVPGQNILPGLIYSSGAASICYRAFMVLALAFARFHAKVKLHNFQILINNA